MANSAQQQIVAAVAALFNVATALAGGRVFQNRDFSLANGIASQVHVNYGGSAPMYLHMGTDSPQDHDTEIEVVILTRKVSGGSEAPVAGDEIFTEAYARVMADQSLGSRVWQLTDGEKDNEPEADTSVNRITWRFNVKHRTANNVITP
jgi:hypothetical protein